MYLLPTPRKSLRGSIRIAKAKRFTALVCRGRLNSLGFSFSLAPALGALSLVVGNANSGANDNKLSPRRAHVAKMSKLRAWVVDFESDAVIDFEDVKSRGDRKAVFSIVQKLRAAGRSELPAEQQRLAPARELVATLLRYRAEHKLSQKALAKKLGLSQPSVVKLESGEHNPEVARSSTLFGAWGSSSCLTWPPQAASRRW